MTGEVPVGKEYVLEGFAVPHQLDAVHTLAQTARDHPSLDSTGVMQGHAWQRRRGWPRAPLYRGTA